MARALLPATDRPWPFVCALRQALGARFVGVLLFLAGALPSAQAALSISLSTPAAGSSHLAPATLVVSASVSGVDPNTPITKVEFFQGTTLIGTATAAPYIITWSNVPAGSYSLTARATDSAGGVATSAARTITVTGSNTPPTVSLSTPAAGSSYLAPASLVVSASASGVEANTPITKVEFFQGTTLIGTATTSPYTVTWSNVPAGSYSLTAKATDSAGGVATSAARTITVTGSNTPPTVSLSTPAAGSSYLAPASLVVSASASGVEANTPITKVEFFQGTTLIGTATTSPYTVTWSNVPAGSYSLTARATDSAGGVATSAARTITVTGSNAPPTVSLSTPAAGSSHLAPASLVVSASASGVEANTPITKVEFFQGTTLIGTATTSPYTVTWSNVPAGSYSLTARATDSAGGVATSAARTITVTGSNTPPTVSLTAPAAGATFTAPASVTLSASASDTDGTVAKVEFFQGTTLIGTATTSPYTVTWNNVPAGSYSLTAKATDNAGGITSSAARTITVNPANQLPTVSLTAPAAGATFTAPASVTLSASASDTDGTVAKVEFFQGTTLIGTATAAPYTVAWNSVPAGSYSLTAKATDNAGGITTSAARTITVNPANQLPTVSLTAPAAGATFTAPASVTLSATATDTDGTITKVEFFQGTTLIGTATAAPYTVTWSNVPAGSYSLTAKATDNAGGVATSAARTITVTGTGPTILYLHSDHLGTPRAATNEANVVVWRNRPTTEPFGMELPEEDPDGDGRTTVINLRFPGQYFDRETLLHYNY